MPGLTLDAGALIAFDRNDRRVVALIARCLAHRYALIVPAGVVGQASPRSMTEGQLAQFDQVINGDIRLMSFARDRATFVRNELARLGR
jgi:hypothetical protein